ncbi:MFS transporter [Staphylococcus simiae]|uniref:Putative permease n=1 Tax=Staphylococcus simiae CCM 7213 = CCUG 51256 TaxID=911238 RepID=G5JKD9_9STAP|nr:MFS transporter [Staphylococcus simiae]EHJ07363.1 putative permease [Staphylococcus simiae CCM 7213 = CCUG 51256]SNV71476.1 major facilitator family transporter [Staphylococcus simiae]
MKQNFIFLIIFTLISNFGSSIFAFIVSFYFLKESNNAIIFSILIATTTLSNIVFKIIAGYFADLLNKKYLVLVTQFLSVLVLAIFSLNTDSIENYKFVIILLIILAMSDSFSSIVFNSGMVNIVGEQYLQKFITVNMVMLNIITIFSPIIGGLLFSIFDIKVFIYLIFCTETISLLILILIKIPEIRNNMSESKDIISIKRFFKDYIKTFKYISEFQELLILLCLSLAMNFFFSISNIGLQTGLVKVFKFDSLTYSLIVSALSLGIILISLVLIGLKDLDIKKNLTLSISVMSLSYLILSLNFIYSSVEISKYTLFFIMLVIGVSLGLYNATSSIFKQTVIQDNLKGKYFGLETMVAQIAMPLGYILGGILFEINTYIYPLIFITIVFILIIVLFILKRNFKII